MDVLDRLYHVFRLRPFEGRRVRSLRRMPKACFWDWSLVPDPGSRFENLLASHLLKFVHELQDVDGHDVELMYLRDRAGHEAKLYAKCNGTNYQNNMLTLAPGATIACPLRVEFDSGGRQYWLQMNPYGEEGAYPETNWANITCIFPTSGTSPCAQWRIEPSGTYTAPDGSVWKRNVAVLLQVVTSKGKTSYLKQGDFNVSFIFVVTNP